ncbi:cysteine desulfuration protein SufE/hypothetical protein [Cricetibacter osteomyelitidis]|uniref:Fe-S metabolism associated domain-containing protein n=1 Tax=Cricetibacter osteomyelitidis TaxID=1521931 RepID=A0A4R2T1U9_9PAST|nr:SufE family protein [Cricetibacter osteomyelitidis]TCP96869.1 cysteine desulfuration protein SufE/hypothetical protein [Cricetibacter osteomyelitidis]
MNLQAQLIAAKTWEERYRLIIQAGKNLSRPNNEELQAMSLINGCEAKVWFKISPNSNRTFHFSAYSEARIINGLLWILLLEIQDKSAVQLQVFSLTDYFDKLGIAQRLSTTRLNGLKQIEQILHQLN